jgi:outer membrane lipoprotein
MKSAFAIFICTLLLMSCSVISNQVRKEAVSVSSFAALVKDVEQYRDQTIIVGGSVLKVDNQTSGTVITALQVPLKSGDKPGSKDQSDGRLIISTPQFLDPEVYTKGRKITVAGKIIGSSRDEVGTAPIPYLKLESIELHLWPQYQPSRYYYPHYSPFWAWNDPWYRGYHLFDFHDSHHRRHHHRRYHTP